MSKSDDLTEESLNGLEKKIKSTYKKAYTDLEKKSRQYFAQYAQREADLIEALENGQIPLQAGETKESYLKAWREAQTGRGKRWEAMRDQMAKRMTQTNEIASAYINDKTPSIYSINQGYTAYEIGQGMEGISFTLYDEQTVKALITGDENFTEFRTVSVNPTRDYEWNQQEIQKALTSAILNGSSMKDLAGAFEGIMQRNSNAALRNARTAYTSAQNGGRINGMRQARAQGINVRKQWLSAHDGRVRDSHAMLNGQIRDVDEKFDNGLLYPAESSGRPAEVYNCRCTLTYIYPEWDNDESSEIYHDAALAGETYQQFVKRMKATAPETIAENKARYAKTTAKTSTAATKKISVTQTATKAKLEETKENTTKEIIKKTDFTPAKTVEEAEEFAKTLTESGRWMSNGVSYSGLNLEVANTINETIADFQNTFKVDKLSGVSAPALNTKIGKAIDGAHMGYNKITGDLLINKKTCKSAKAFESDMKATKAQIDAYLEDPSRFSFKSSLGEKIYNASRQSGRGEVAENIQEAVWHELGHSLEKNVKAMPNYNIILENRAKYGAAVSGYATASENEYIAESFASYLKGESVIDPELAKAFDSLRR